MGDGDALVARAKHVAGFDSFAAVHWHGIPFCCVKPQYCALMMVACEQSVSASRGEVLRYRVSLYPYVFSCSSKNRIAVVASAYLGHRLTSMPSIRMFLLL